MSDIQELKALCRKAAFAARKDAHALGLDKEANAQLTSFLKMQADDLVIAAYMPIRTEVSPLPAMEKMAVRGRDICVPVVIGNGQPLEFHRWTPDCEMVEGAFGAMIPAVRDAMFPDVVITPLAAFDMNGYRLGYGGGFYDRSFAELSEKKHVQAIGFAYDAQEVMIVPREDTDFRLNAMITEKGILSFDK
jgi:5-formyltetrahydrofolate cyclo-ligase